ncbi:MAG: DUF2971 domain-containing protein [Albidovulum sp.]
MNESEKTEKLRSLIFPYATQKFISCEKNNSRFVYYTSASTGLKIINNEEVWLRNAAVMNDFSEVHHGQNCVHRVWTDNNIGGRFKSFLESLNPDGSNIFAKSFDADQHWRTTQSYILSISEHGDQSSKEDHYGRLSMWRAYGGDTNVAFVFKNRPFLAPTDALQAYTCPVQYKDVEDFLIEFGRNLDQIEKEFDFFKEIGWEEVFPYFYQAFRYAVLATKHPGFSEEKEWRIVYSPTHDVKRRLIPATEVISGVPQIIYKIRLQNIAAEGLLGMTLPELLDKILIGPTQYPVQIAEAFIAELKEVGVSDAEQRVAISGIPLRRPI